MRISLNFKDYSFVHFIILAPYDPLMNFTSGSKQFQWLEKDLKSVNRSETPWIIVGHHFPAYSSNARYRENIKVRDAFDLLFVKYNVNIVINGHVHSYERSCQVFNSKCDKRGPVC
jgi:acid phosphatase type 7